MAKKKIIPSNQQMKPPETVELWNSYAFQWNPRFSVLELSKTQPNIRKSVHIPMSSWEVIKSASCRSFRQHDLCHLPPELSEQLENSHAIGDHRAWADAIKRQTLWYAERRWSRQWLDAPPFSTGIQLAQQSGDEEFFIELGKRLAKPPLDGVGDPLDKVDEFLLFNWCRDEAPDGVFLTVFSDEALCELCYLVLKRENQMGTIRKRRQRLHLKKLARPIIRSVTMKNGVILATA